MRHTQLYRIMTTRLGEGATVWGTEPPKEVNRHEALKTP